METMHAAGRRTLPPVPRPTGERVAETPEESGQPDSPTERFVVDLATAEQRAVVADDLPDDVDHLPADEDGDGDGAASAGADEETSVSVDDDVHDEPSATQEPDLELDDLELDELDPAQEFVARLRTAAADFAAAADAESAVVREAVPPARHRRARCRVVLRYADASEVDLTFLGPAGRPGSPSRHGFDRQIRRWLADGQRREAAWLVTDPDAQDGLAVDLSAWIAAA